MKVNTSPLVLSYFNLIVEALYAECVHKIDSFVIIYQTKSSESLVNNFCILKNVSEEKELYLSFLKIYERVILDFRIQSSWDHTFEKHFSLIKKKSVFDRTEGKKISFIWVDRLISFLWLINKLVLWVKLKNSIKSICEHIKSKYYFLLISISFFLRIVKRMMSKKFGSWVMMTYLIVFFRLESIH